MKYVLLPRKLTDEEKYAFLGEFVEQCNFPCPECYMDEDPDCGVCWGRGMIDMDVPISWTTIKKIYDRIVDHFERKKKKCKWYEDEDNEGHVISCRESHGMYEGFSIDVDEFAYCPFCGREIEWTE